MESLSRSDHGRNGPRAESSAATGVDADPRPRLGSVPRVVPAAAAHSKKAASTAIGRRQSRCVCRVVGLFGSSFIRGGLAAAA